MKKLFIALFFLLSTFSPSFVYSGESLATNADVEYVVYLEGSKDKKEKVAKEFKTADTTHLDQNIFTIKGSERSKAEAKKKQPNKKEAKIIAYSENKKYEVSVIPNDPEYLLGKQWGLSKISAPAAWDVTTGDVNNVIAVLDTGFKLDHVDLVSKMIAGYDFVDNDADPSLPDGGGLEYYHGTMVAGTAAAATNNSIGIAGVDWLSKIMPLRVMDNDGGGYTDDIAAAVIYAKNNGANVINMSLGYDCLEGTDPVLEAAIEDAYAAGVTIVAASGNKDTCVSYPARYDEVIAVGATDSSDVRASFSNYGPELDVVAPGVSIYTTNTNWNGLSYDSSYAYASGTSLASPHVAGLASLLKSQSDYSPLEIKNLITSGVDKVAGMSGADFTNEYGYGRINSLESVNPTLDYSKIAQNTLRVTVGDYSTEDPDDYLYRFSSPAIGERIILRAALRNDNSLPATIENIRIIGVYDNGVKFVAGTVSSLTIPANSISVLPTKPLRLTSFRTVYFVIDYIQEGVRMFPYIGPTYSPMKIRAHFPNVKVVSTPAFSPSSTTVSTPLTGVFKIKNFDSRPAYLREIRLRTCTSGLCWSFPNIVRELAPGEVYKYVQPSTPTVDGIYTATVRIIYGNGSLSVPGTVTGINNYGSYGVVNP